MSTLSEFWEFFAKFAIVVASSPAWGWVCYKLLCVWSDQKKEHIELAAQEFDKRILALEKITVGHAARMDQNEVSNKALAVELNNCKSQLLKTSQDIGALGGGLNETINHLSDAIVRRIEDDEVTLKSHSQSIQDLGKIIFKK